jgi:hypothetical protein
MQSFRKFIHVLVLNLAVLSILLLVVELVYGGWFDESNGTSRVIGVIRNVEYRYESDLFPGAGEIHYTRDSFGLRGIRSRNHPEQIDVLTVGGSTTDQRMITDSLTWQERLERDLAAVGHPLVFGNAGIDGQSTIGHIKNFEIWFPKVRDLRPRYVLFYIGLNDVFRLDDTNRFDVMQEYNLLGNVLRVISEKSAVYNLFRKVRGTVNARDRQVSHQKVDFPRLQWTEETRLTPDLISGFDSMQVPAFRSRIERLAESTLAMGATPVFISQPARFFKVIDTGKVVGVSQGLPFKGKVLTGVDQYNCLKKLNGQMKDVAGSRFPYIDITDSRGWEDDDFYDYLHMTPKGTEKLAGLLFTALRPQLENVRTGSR